MQMHSMAMLSILFVSGGFSVATAQPAEMQSPSITAGTLSLTSNREELLRQIKVCEDALRNAESIHAAPLTLAKIEMMIGGLYEDAGAYPQAEAAYQSALDLVRRGHPQSMAVVLRQLAGLHAIMGEFRKSEKESIETLALWQQLGDARGVAFTQVDLANAEIREHKFSKAIENAQKALAVIGNDSAVQASDRIGVRQTLGYALSEDQRCGEAMEVLNGALQLDKSNFGDDGLPVGIGYYVLGHAAWNCGQPADAAAWMQRGIDRMKRDLGWGHPVYITAMTEYAKFLRERGQEEEAASAEREIRMSQSVVDARTLGAPVSALH
jgi:tetratricopeptide (TPR) repeat protein